MDDSEQNEHEIVEADSSPNEYFKFGLLIAGITAISFALNAGLDDLDLLGWMRWFMGVFFVVFATFKFIGYEMFIEMYPTYDLIAQRFKAYAYAYPFIQLVLGVMYLLDSLPGPRDVFTVIIMSAGAYGIWRSRGNRHGIRCACLGNVIQLPLSTVSFIEDAGMAIMALVLLLA